MVGHNMNDKITYDEIGEPNDDREALAKVMDTLAYYHCRANNPKADHPVQGYHAFSEEQRDHLREKQREGAEEIVRVFAATRVPVQGEPNDDRAEIFYCPIHGDLLDPRMSRSYRCLDAPEGHEYVTPRASVPDAATEAVQAELEEMAGRFSEYLCETTGGMLSKTGYDVSVMVNRAQEYYDRQAKEYHDDCCERSEELEAERDAALAAIGRLTRAKFEVDSVHQIHGTECLCGFSSSRSRSRTEHITDALVAALDGAPEPDDEPEEMYQAGCGSWDCRAPECGKA